MFRSANGVMLMIWMIVFTVLCPLVLALRFWAIKLTNRALRVDDCLVVFAFVCPNLRLQVHVLSDLPGEHNHNGSWWLLGHRQRAGCTHF